MDLGALKSFTVTRAVLIGYKANKAALSDILDSTPGFKLPHCRAPSLTPPKLILVVTSNQLGYCSSQSGAWKSLYYRQFRIGLPFLGNVVHLLATNSSNHFLTSKYSALVAPRNCDATGSGWGYFICYSAGTWIGGRLINFCGLNHPPRDGKVVSHLSVSFKELSNIIVATQTKKLKYNYVEHLSKRYKLIANKIHKHQSKRKTQKV